MKYEISEQCLILEWGMGSRAGVENLYDQYAANIYKVVYSIVRDKDRKAPVFEQTFFKIWHSFAEFSTQEHRLAIWILARHASSQKHRLPPVLVKMDPVIQPNIFRLVR